MRTFSASALALLTSFVVLAGCASHAAEDDEEDDSALGDASALKIVEVSGNPVGGAGNAFVELRNDGDKPVALDGLGLAVGGGDGGGLEVRKVLGKANNQVAGHGLALIVDASMADAEVQRVACDAAIATSRANLGSDHAAADDPLMGALGIQQDRHCVPVLALGDLGQKLSSATKVALTRGGSALDSAAARFGQAPRGIAYERKGAGDDMVLSPLGSTPGARNYFSTEGGTQPIRVYFASPWRNSTAPQQGRNSDGLPPNPLAGNLSAAIDGARKSAVGSFFQINDPGVIDSLVKAKTDRHADVRLTTDADYIDDPEYTPGYKKFKQAGIPLKFDVNEQGKNRAPLSHNKFLVFDDEWLWTGSYNPIYDETARIHADNAVLFHSPLLAALQKKEFETIFAGKFGTMKRDEGVSGGDAYVDGARVSLRFSPGISDVQAKARAAAFSQTNDAAQACAVARAGKPVLDDRYRNVDPCGGPLDLLYGEVARATSSVYFVEFSLALPMLGDVMVERMKKGNVEVKGVVDATIASKPLPTQLTGAGADVRATPNSDPTCPAYVSPRNSCPKNPNKVWLHHKFLLIDYGTDHPVVITGSHNMSDSAEQQNDETLVVIHDRAVAESYYRIFRDAFDHPQALGDKRPKADMPVLAITKVQPNADPKGKQIVEITNFDTKPQSLNGLVLWNRLTAVQISDNHTIAPGAKAVITIGDAGNVSAGSGGIVIPLNVNANGRAFVSPSSPLVLATMQRDWIATYDPYTSAQNLPQGVNAAAPGTAYAWTGFDRAALDEVAKSFLGVNSTPDAAKPTWTQRGLFSDWADEYDVTPLGLLLMKSAQAAWTPVN